MTEKIRIGIIITETNKEDLGYYKNELIKIDKELDHQITFVLFGLSGTDEDLKWFKQLGFKFEWVKKVSIIHYFKQLIALELNLLFIPLINDDYNRTSENYNKFLETAIINIPVITTNMFPYNKLIQDKQNGFLFNEKEDFFDYIKSLSTQKKAIQQAGKEAYELVSTKFNYSEENMDIIDDLFI